WTHLELRRPFGITGTLFGPDTAESIWTQCNEKLATPAFSARGWVMQLHIGAIRNNNTRMFRLLGPDTGFDSIGDNNISWAL
ncbi:glucuronate isomerase, partial [Salmonella enterica]|uniref:glucuronate isomerase n=1 Tax=Salmonella enterica TaxID=28901 RepID=UPI001C460297